ncbi:MAG: hypothetical protein ACE5ET_05910 [Gammaproteobacteria bacterium]
MEVTRKIKPGENGSKRYLRAYGDRLICVRYCNDRANRKNLVTVELIVAEHPHPSGRHELFNTMYPHPNRWVMVRIGYEEKQLQQVVKQRGGKWIKSKQLWGLPYRIVQELKLEGRMASDVESHPDEGV